MMVQARDKGLVWPWLSSFESPAHPVKSLTSTCPAPGAHSTLWSIKRENAHRLSFAPFDWVDIIDAAPGLGYFEGQSELQEYAERNGLGAGPQHSRVPTQAVLGDAGRRVAAMAAAQQVLYNSSAGD
jgi:hypothetical protein